MDGFRLRSLSFGGQVVAYAPLRKGFAFVAGNDGLMHLGGRKHIIVLDRATIHIMYAKTKMPGTSPGMTSSS
jgi:hypothetical protein